MNSQPDFTNEKGVKWWRDIVTTEYAQKADKYGVTLDAVCFIIEEPNGIKTRLLISSSKEIIEEAQSLEGMAAKIDIRKLLKRR